jgi:anti-sigma-K factor RskA
LRAAASRAAAQPDARGATLSGSGGEVRVVVDATGLAYVDSSLATLGADRAYQLWTLDSGTPVSLGLLGRTPGMVVVNVGSARSLAITAELAS